MPVIVRAHALYIICEWDHAAPHSTTPQHHRGAAGAKRQHQTLDHGAEGVETTRPHRGRGRPTDHRGGRGGGPGGRSLTSEGRRTLHPPTIYIYIYVLCCIFNFYRSIVIIYTLV